MLKKMAAIANFADANGEYEIANSLTQITKEAQLFDALRTLFDPGHSGMDRDAGYWKRLQRGWSRGKMDRGLGLLLAINAERTKLNRKIDELAAPIKNFQDQVGSFYDKLRAGSSDVNAGNLRNELRDLQNGLKETLKLVSGKELKNALKLRERLQDQQIKALEKVKGLDPETKEYLGSVLKGEKPGEAPNTQAKPDVDAPTAIKMTSWLRSLGLKSRVPTDRKSKNLNIFRQFIKDYHTNPISIVEFFNANPQAMEKGFDLFGKDFGEMYYWAENVVRTDNEQAEKEKAEIPGAPDAVVEEKEDPITTPMSAKQEVAPELPTPSPFASRLEHLKPVVPDVSPTSHGLTPEEEQIRKEEVRPALDKMRAERDKDIFRRYKERQDKTRSLLKPEVPAAPLATSSAERLTREITRFGRIKQLEKIADEMIPDDEFIDENCQYEPDECHFCGNVSDINHWLCSSCGSKADRIGISHKELAYADPDWLDDQLAALDGKDLPVIEDASGVELTDEEQGRAN